jgi:hypothetical protein
MEHKFNKSNAVNEDMAQVNGKKIEGTALGTNWAHTDMTEWQMQLKGGEGSSEHS